MQLFQDIRRLALMLLATLAGLLILTAIRSAAAQDTQEVQSKAHAQSTLPADSALAMAARRITLDVAVTDKQGKHIRGLSAQDFTLLDNSQPKKLTAFRAVNSTKAPANPVHVIIVIDNINSTFDTVAREREQLGEFLKENNGQLAHPTSIAMITDTGLKLESGSSEDGNALLSSFNNVSSQLRIVGDDTGLYGAAERLEISLSQLGDLAAYEQTQPGRKLVLVASPGWPMLDWVGTEADMNERAWVFKSVMALTNGLREAHMTLYSLEPFELGRVDPFYYEDYLKGVTRVADADYPDLSLQVLAEHTGGLVLVTGNDIKQEIDTAVRDADSYYELTFEAAPGTSPDEYHALVVKTDKPGTTARTTTGYYTNTMPSSPARASAGR